MKTDYTTLSFTQLVDKIETNRFFDLPRMVREAFKRLNTQSTPKYKVYTALLTQSGTDAPVPTVLENTLGDIVWTRIDEGVYIGTLSNSFIENKTGVIINNTAYASDNQITTVDVLTTSTVNIQTSRTTEGVFGLEDSCMYNNLIEIRVYN